MKMKFIGVLSIATVAFGFASLHPSAPHTLIGRWEAETKIMKKVVSIGPLHADTFSLKGQFWDFRDKDFAESGNKKLTGYKELIIYSQKKEKPGKLFTDTIPYKLIGKKISFYSGSYYTIKLLGEKKLVISQNDTINGKSFEKWIYFNRYFDK